MAIAATLALAVQAREGVEVGKNSAFADLVPAEEVEKAAVQQYRALQQQASQRRALLAGKHRQVQRLQRIADRIIPLALAWNPRARGWKWEVSVIDAPEINAFCMPGGKIAFYTGLLDKLALTDDEVAMVMGHEIAHALREHARERMGKSAVTRSAAQLGGALLAGILGIDPRITDTVARGGATLLTLEFSRDDESEADLVGMELAARAGYDPRAGVSLWQKMGRLDKESPPQWLSTHPSGNNRIAEIKKNLPHVLPLYERARQSESTAPDIVPAR
ncbi:MAG: M48 family metallopeptidase [Hylemonella sp.]|nr:M48 family metallopeptidase [Hylemonella sp.]